MCPLQNHFLGMWINCPHSYSPLSCKICKVPLKSGLSYNHLSCQVPEYIFVPNCSHKCPRSFCVYVISDLYPTCREIHLKSGASNVDISDVLFDFLAVDDTVSIKDFWQVGIHISILIKLNNEWSPVDCWFPKGYTYLRPRFYHFGAWKHRIMDRQLANLIIWRQI